MRAKERGDEEEVEVVVVVIAEGEKEEGTLLVLVLLMLVPVLPPVLLASRFAAAETGETRVPAPCGAGRRQLGGVVAWVFMLSQAQQHHARVKKRGGSCTCGGPERPRRLALEQGSLSFLSSGTVKS